jgi:peptidoglycan/xylan/chitin deacetylase (PgdA/CDA1 family)
MRVALKIDVPDTRAALDAVPVLLDLLETYRLRASFAFAVGRPAGWLASLGPGAGIAKRVPERIRAVVAAGHEAGVAAHHARRWQREAAFADGQWTQAAVDEAVDAFSAAAKRAPDFFAAAGWQLNPHLLAAESALGLTWASDVRGRYPFLPQLQGQRSDCAQIPTTLPTLDEVLGAGRATLATAHEFLYAESRHVRPAGHVYSARADREGGELAGVMEKLLVMWKGYDGAVRPLGEILGELDRERLPVHQVGWAEFAGRDGHLAAQSVEVPR